MVVVVVVVEVGRDVEEGTKEGDKVETDGNSVGVAVEALKAKDDGDRLVECADGVAEIISYM